MYPFAFLEIGVIIGLVEIVQIEFLTGLKRNSSKGSSEFHGIGSS